MKKLLFLLLIIIFIVFYSPFVVCAEFGKSIVSQHHKELTLITSQNYQACSNAMSQFVKDANKAYGTFKTVYAVVDLYSNGLPKSKLLCPAQDALRVFNNLKSVHKVYLFTQGLNATAQSINTSLNNFGQLFEHLCVTSAAGVGVGAVLQLSEEATPRAQATIGTLGACILTGFVVDNAIRNFSNAQPHGSVECIKLFMGGVVVGFAFTRGGKIGLALSEQGMKKAVELSKQGAQQAFNAAQQIDQHFDNVQDYVVQKSLKLSIQGAEAMLNKIVIPLAYAAHDPNNEVIVGIIGALIKTTIP